MLPSLGFHLFEDGNALEIKSSGEDSRQSPLLKKFRTNFLTLGDTVIYIMLNYGNRKILVLVQKSNGHKSKGGSMKINKVLWVLFVGGFLLGFTSNGFAQKYPTKPIRVIVAYTAGGSNTWVAQALATPMGKRLNGTMVIVNMPGGSTKVAAYEVMKSDPDGHTLLLLGHGAMMGYYYSGTYDQKVWEKMTYIAQVGETPFGFFEVRMDSPFKTWADLVSFAKKNPGKLLCGLNNAGGMNHLIGVETAKDAGIDVKFVPFAGAQPNGVALLGGHVNYRICSPIDAFPNMKAGKTRGLGVSYDKRLPGLPDVPTFKELGLKSEFPPMTYGYWGPPNLPPNIVDQISRAVKESVKDPGYLELCERIQYQPVFKDAQMLKKDVAFFEKKVGPRLEATFPRK